MPLRLNLLIPNKAVHAFIGLVVVVALVVGVYAYTFPANFLGHGGDQIWINTLTGETDLQAAIDSGLLGADNDWEKVGGGEPALTDDMYHTGNVGIGTTNPSTILTIGNTGTEEQVLLDNTSLKLISQTGATNTILNDDTGISYISALGGNVGIGTTSPSQKLEVAGNALINGELLGITKLSFDEGTNFRIDTNPSGLLFDGGDGTWDFLIYDNVIYSDVLRLGYAGSARIDTYNTDEDLIIDPNGNGDIILQDDATGNVGIGTTNPSQKLDVSGQIHATGDICTDAGAGGGVCLSDAGGGGGSFDASVSKNVDTVYTAATSGILVVRAYIRARYEHNYVEIRSDDSAVPTTVVGHIGAWCGDNCNTGMYHTMSVPILKGKNYRVVVKSASGAQYVIVNAIEFYPHN